MYSVVLMMALSGSADVPAWGRGGGCGGGGACWGGAACYGGCGGGRFLGGRGCGGCHGFLGGRRHGCCGCSGYSCGCAGYSAGCCGCAGYSAGCGCSGYVNGGCIGTAPAAAPAAPAVPPAKLPEKVPSPKTKTMAPAPATIYVSLPAEAKLLVDDVVTKATSSNRVFVSPNLPPDQEFSYTLTAEVVREGKTVSISRKVAVRAGEETRVSLELPTATVALK